MSVLPGRRRTTVTVGTFDGIHLGHQAVLHEIVRRAKAGGRASVLVTFEPHPLRIVAPERAPCLLTTLAEKRLLWPLFGIDYVHVLRFTEEFRQLSPEEFVRRILIGRLRMGELVIGHDHGFGKDRKGDVETLRRLGAEEEFTVHTIPAVERTGAAISSTRMRKAIAEGDLAGAEDGLGRPYSVLGEIVPGAGRGRKLGFPTANFRLEDDTKCLPPAGVYAVRVELGGDSFQGMANLGGRPTFGEHGTRLEAHLLDAPGGSLYGARPSLRFVARLRGIRHFPSPAALATQLEQDRAAARAVLGGPAGGRGG